MSRRILVCDDEADIRESLALLLRDEGYDVGVVSTGAAAVAEAAECDAVLLDIKMTGQDGLETLAEIRKKGLRLPVVMISGHADIRTAMEAIRAGANDFLEKPLSTEHVLNALRRVLDASRLTRENEELRGRLGLTRIVGSSARMKRLLSEVARAAPTPATILVRGPSGTGKELVARALHDGSLVRTGPFVQVNCAAIPESLIESELFGHERGSFTGADRKQVGKFVEADGGTIFLDEVGDMSAPTQAKVLRVLQEGEVEPVGSPRVVKVKVRVVAATNRDLEGMIREGKFREDLYYRLNVLELATPPLSEHAEDVPELALFFSTQFARTNNYRPRRFTDAALEDLAGRPWPGNVRELKNLIERVMIMSEGETIDRPQLAGWGAASAGREAPAPVIVRGGRVVRPEGEDEAAPLSARSPISPTSLLSSDGIWPRLLATPSLQAFQDEAEKHYLVEKLAEFGGNVTRTAEAIGTPRSNLYKKIDRYGLRRDRGEAAAGEGEGE
jgi:two-component system nitrogen regulation response regulator NtrX